MHAAQIYAELLGLVCHRKQYMGNLQGNQEVSTTFSFPIPPYFPYRDSDAHVCRYPISYEGINLNTELIE